MTSLYVFAALACLLVDHAIAVVELTDNTFYDYAKDKDVLLVDFYAPWCPDCKNLDPDFESAAQSLGTRSLDLAKVDCFGAGKGLCATYGIKRWPTLKNFNRGTFTGDYNGGLTSSEIAGYITTVENSVTPNSNPYAMVVPQPIQQACISRCKIAKVPNNHNCFTKCKDKPFSTHNGAKKLMNMKMIAPKPVINEKSCAKCRIPQPAGRKSGCTPAQQRSCILRHKAQKAQNQKAAKRFNVQNLIAPGGTALKTKQTLRPNLKLPNNALMNGQTNLPSLNGIKLEAFAGDINSLPPRVALKIPYAKNDKKNNIGGNNLANSTFKGDINLLTPREAMKLPYARND